MTAGLYFSIQSSITLMISNKSTLSKRLSGNPAKSTPEAPTIFAASLAWALRVSKSSREASPGKLYLEVIPSPMIQI
mgnify:CR=1 FL=1|jgi:hypothetical protein|tara:strand:- start:190 stop:420 length:231 start_codon:yes stop_codon:yes gene_type:complete